MRAVVLVVLAGCGRLSFDEQVRDVPHLPGLEPSGTESLAVTSTIDTTELTVDGEPRLVAMPQPGGPEVAVLEVAQLVIDEGVLVRVQGSRPLIVVATGAIVIDGELDAGGRGVEDGPGAAALAGEDGVHVGAVCDLGGGGGGHATPGAPGGLGTECGASVARAGGAVLGDPELTILAGGMRGGAGAAGAGCGTPSGGGGGGALQLSARHLVKIGATGLVTAGGGGGAAGLECAQGDAGSGAGGGAGGAIVLDAPRVIVDGAVAATGGGGGSGGNGNPNLGPVGNGAAGRDGRAEPGAGGASLASNSGTGGTGGSDGIAPTAGADVIHNAGGGGGAAGRIQILDDD